MSPQVKVPLIIAKIVFLFSADDTLRFGLNICPQNLTIEDSSSLFLILFKLAATQKCSKTAGIHMMSKLEVVGS